MRYLEADARIVLNAPVRDDAIPPLLVLSAKALARNVIAPAWRPMGEAKDGRWVIAMMQGGETVLRVRFGSRNGVMNYWTSQDRYYRGPYPSSAFIGFIESPTL